MLSSEDVQLSYQFFYQRVYSEPKYILTFTTTNSKLCDSFFKELRKTLTLESLGYNWLWKYLVFQFDYWDNLTITAFNGKMNFAFIFGQKAVNRYLQRNQEYDWQLEDSNVVSKYKISKNEFELLFRVSTVKQSYQNPNRLIGLNTESGLVNCIATTTLYDINDHSCTQCKYSKECKELLRLNYPKIYKDRGYAKTTNR